MNNAEHLFAQRSLAAWCRGHGIHEIRSVLTQAADLAGSAESAEDLADQLEADATAAEAVVNCPMPEPVAAAPAAEEPPAKKRRAHAASGHFKPDDHSTPEVNEAWAAD